MRQFYKYLLTRPGLERARFLLPSLFLITSIFFLATTSTVFAQTKSTLEICDETQRVMDQYEREHIELLRKRVFKQGEESVRTHLSALDQAIKSGTLIKVDRLVQLAKLVKIELPKDSDDSEKLPVQLTVQERSALQRVISSVLGRELEEAVNTTLDRIDDRLAKNRYQVKIRQQRLKDLNCAQVLKDASVEGEGDATSTGDAACWNGTFGGTDTGRHTMTINLTQGADGTVTGGWRFNQSGTLVKATITEATVKGNSLEGKWTQTGVEMSGSFVWTWLPDQNCKAFEGSFNGTKYWIKMVKQ